MKLTESAELFYCESIDDPDGYAVETEVKTEVLVDKKDVFDTTKFAAMASGVAVTIMFEMWKEDFELTKRIINGKKVFADKIRYDGEVYKIINASVADNSSIIRLTCE